MELDITVTYVGSPPTEYKLFQIIMPNGKPGYTFHVLTGLDNPQRRRIFGAHTTIRGALMEATGHIAGKHGKAARDSRFDHFTINGNEISYLNLEFLDFI